MTLPLCHILTMLCILLGLLGLPAAAQDRAPKPAVVSAEQRIALVIGNSQYKDSPLPNPVNDARAVAKALAASGFKVTTKENAGQKDMQLAMREFGDALKAGGVGLFYYAGHGMQVKGRNFLIPVDARIQREDEVAYNSVDAGQVLDKMEAANNRLNIVILDACRNNPFARSFRSGSAGLAQMDAPVGTLIAFATAPGSVASDGAKIEDVFKNVRASVRKDSAGKQIPWESTSLEGDFIFVPQPPVPPATVNAAQTQPQKIDAIAQPLLHIGDRWDYQVIDLMSGSVTEKFTRRLTGVAADELQFGSYITDKSLNLLRRVNSGKAVTTWQPKRPYHEFPMHSGKTWESTGVVNNDRLVSEHAFSYRVVRQEQVIVPAGIFDTLRVEGSSKYKTKMKTDGTSGEGYSTYRYWFSPRAGSYVAFEFEESNWKGVIYKKERTELLSYSRDGKK